MTNKKVNKFLGGQQITKHEYEDFCTVAEQLSEAPEDDLFKVLEWFKYLHTIETPGWRPKSSTQKMATMLLHALDDRAHVGNINFYSLFCPSYKKGEGAYGFRTDGVGDTTRWGLKTLWEIYSKTNELGFNEVMQPLAIFFDIAVEQPDKASPDDLEINIKNFKKEVPKGVYFQRLSEMFPELKDIVGYRGVKVIPSLVPNSVVRRVRERGAKFYELFGWTDEQISERTSVICSSEAIVGSLLRQRIKDSIMVYTPTMLERAQVYSGNRQEDPLPIIFPRHEGL